MTDQLGSGGMGTVYRAIPEDTWDESQAVALKLLHPQLASAPDSVAAGLTSDWEAGKSSGP